MSDCKRILASEIERWESMPVDQLISELTSVSAYQVKDGPSTCQVEVELLENTETYIHVMVAVDNGRFLSALKPATDSFIVPKHDLGLHRR
jgi:hypothetical protein